MEPPDDLNLTEPERRMWDAVMSGQPCNFGDGDPGELAAGAAWGPERTIRGHVLAALLVGVGSIGPPAIRQVHIQGARIIGEVDLRHSELALAVQLERCIFEHGVILVEARTRALRFSTCTLASVDATGALVDGLLGIGHSKIERGVSLLEAKVSNSVLLSGSKIVGDARPALSADRLEAGGGLSLDEGFHATGEVRLLGAQITGQLICSGGRFDNPGGVALGADRANIQDDARLDNGFHATGQVRLLGTQIAGQLICSGGRFENPGDRALAADGAVVGASVVLSELPNSSTSFLAIGTVQLTGARIAGQLNCSGGRFDNPHGDALVADEAEISAGVFLIKTPGTAAGFHASGVVRLPGARIVGQLNCSGGRFDNPNSVALVADAADIRGDVNLGNGLHAAGEVRLLNARIGGQLICAGGRFENPASRALSADGTEVDGSVLLGGIPGAARFHATGEVRLPGAQIAGLLNCAGGRFENPEGTALAADSAEIVGTVLLGKLNGADGFHATGEVRLVNARISDQLDCAGGRFENPGKIALSADRVDIRRGARLASGFHATGEVRLPGARIGGQLICSGGRFEDPEGKALNLHEARLDELLLCDIEIGTAGQINLHGTKVSLLADDPVALASQGITLHLDGFVYERIASNSPQDVSTRLQWLERQRPGYHPQPFDQLAAVFQRSGRDHEATRVLIEKRRKRRETLQGWWRKFGDALLDLSVLYGWQAWRPLAAGFAIFLLVFGLVLAAQAVGLIVSLSDVASPYNPFIHALDVFLPIVDLGVESRWTIDTANGGAFAWLVMAFLWTLKLVGWGTVTLALAALTGIVKRD